MRRECQPMNIRAKIYSTLSLALLLTATFSINAQVEINVGGAVERGTPIAIVPF